jgi:hypothetical protein
MTMSESKQVSIEYIGPDGQQSETFGPLAAGRRYQAAAEFAAYLVKTHPDYWRLPVEKAAPKG